MSHHDNVLLQNNFNKRVLDTQSFYSPKLSNCYLFPDISGYSKTFKLWPLWRLQESPSVVYGVPRNLSCVREKVLQYHSHDLIYTLPTTGEFPFVRWLFFLGDFICPLILKHYKFANSQYFDWKRTINNKYIHTIFRYIWICMLLRVIKKVSHT